MRAGQASRGRAACWLAALIAAAVAGCGSSAPSGEHSVGGVRAAAHQFVADIGARHYKEACEIFTPQARADLRREPGGCVGSISLLYLFLSKELSKWFTQVLPHIAVQGDTAMFEGEVEARYEDGRWHLESRIW